MIGGSYIYCKNFGVSLRTSSLTGGVYFYTIDALLSICIPFEGALFVLTALVTSDIFTIRCGRSLNYVEKTAII